METTLNDYDNERPMPQPGAPQKVRGRGCLFFSLGCLTAVMLPPVAIFALILSIVFFSRNVAETCVETLDAKSESTSYEVLRGEGDKSVLRLVLRGVITGTEEGSWLNEEGSDVAVYRAIKEATKREDIQAILLVIDSPGGDVTASDELYHALEAFKAAGTDKAPRRVVVQARGLLASGAYYCAMQADWIRVQPTTIVGSIGVIMPGINLSALAQKIGLEDASIASGASKDLANPLKPQNPEHMTILKGVIDDMYARFVELVARGRHLTVDQVRKLADGRIYTPTNALNLGLVDEIGYEDTIDAKLAELLGGDITIYTLPTSRIQSLRQLLMAAPASTLKAVLAPALQSSPKPAYQY